MSKRKLVLEGHLHYSWTRDPARRDAMIETEDLLEKCLEQIRIQRILSEPQIVLTKAPKSGRLPAGFPRGRLLSVNGAGESNYSYPAVRVLAWCLKQRPNRYEPEDARATAFEDAVEAAHRAVEEAGDE